MDIKHSMNINRAALADAGAVKNGMRNLDATSLKEATKAAPELKVTSIQEETSAIKSTNDLFGYLKKSEKALNGVESALKEGGETGLAEVSRIMDETRYKDQRVFEAMRQEGGVMVDMKSAMESLMQAGDTEGMEALLSEQKSINATLLADVKEKLLGSSASLDRHITTDIDTIKKDIESMSPVADVNSPDQLKSKLKALLG